MSLLALIDLALIILIGGGAIYAYSRWPGEPKAPASARGRLPADHLYTNQGRRIPPRPPRAPRPPWGES